VAVVQRYRFPEMAVDRFRREHPEVHAEGTALVETAARQGSASWLPSRTRPKVRRKGETSGSAGTGPDRVRL